MQLDIRRIVIFTGDLARLTAFYRDVIGLEIVGQEDGWVDFAAGACRLALHAGKSKVGNRSPKIFFYTDDVGSTRAMLIKRGLTTLGPIHSTDSFDMCDATDPDGNRIGISSRK